MLNKYKVWDKQRKMYIEILSLIHHENGIDGVLGCYNSKTDMPYIMKDIELIQYIGIKDKNDVEIYDNDILMLRHKIEGEMFDWQIIKVIYTAPRWIGISSNGLWTSLNLEDYTQICELEKIGNFYENPELLKNNIKLSKEEQIKVDVEGLKRYLGR